MTDIDKLLARADQRRDPTVEVMHRDDDGDLIGDLAAEIRRLRARPCPYVVTHGTTSHCTLAETTAAGPAPAERRMMQSVWPTTPGGDTHDLTAGPAPTGHVCEVCGQPPVEHAEVDGIWPTPCCAGCPCGTYPTAAPAPTGDQP